MAKVASPRQIAEAQARKSGFLGENLAGEGNELGNWAMNWGEPDRAMSCYQVEPEHEGGEDAEDELDGRDHDWGQRWVEA